LDLLATAIAVVLALPIVAVIASVLFGDLIVFRHLAVTVLPEYVGNTLTLGALVILGVLAIGVPAAWLVSACEFPGRRVLEAALILPMAAPAYVLAYAYADFLSPFGAAQVWASGMIGLPEGSTPLPDIRSLAGAALMLTLTLYPYVYVLARARFLSESRAAHDAARTLGRSATGSIFAVSLPMARPALAAGASLALMETLADYGTVSYFGVPVFTTGIYRAWFGLQDPNAAAQLAALLVGFVAMALFLERVLRGGARYHETGRRDARPDRMRLKGVGAVLAIIMCAAPVLFGFVFPALVLANLLFAAGGPELEFWEHLGNSVTVAALAACVAVAASFVLAVAKREHPKSVAARASALAGLGYAVPGAVIAVGVLTPFGLFDNWLDAFATAAFGVSTGLILTGSVVGLIFAYCVRYLAAALQSVTAGLARITPSVADAARLMGRGRADAFRRVTLPLLAPSALTAALLVFVDVMKELPATLMLRPFDFETLAVAAHQYAADERLGFAAAPSLAIVIAGIVPCLVLMRMVARASQYGEPPPLP
jgi:iron(III) transport system permease protein